MRLEGKTAIIIGAGQSPGQGIGNGRATAIRFSQEGARVLAVDRDMDSAQETAAMITKTGAECIAFEADVTVESTLADAIAYAHKQWGRIDILDNNVGVSVGGGDQPLLEITEETFDRINAINLRGTIMACKHVVPVMREQGSGAIINISSMAAWILHPAARARQCVLRRASQRDSSRPDGHTDGSRYPRARDGEDTARNRCHEGRQGAATRKDGHGLGCRQRRAVPRF